MNALFDTVRRKVSKFEHRNWARYRSAVATAVAKFTRSIVLSLVDIFKLDNFTGSIMLLFHIES